MESKRNKKEKEKGFNTGPLRLTLWMKEVIFFLV